MRRSASERARPGPESSRSRRHQGRRLLSFAAGPLLAALLILAPSWGCGTKKPAGPPNILLISIDTLRQDHLGCYGYPRPTSPNIDRLAREGIVFDRALAPSSWTLPSHVSLLTGTYPAFHRVQDDGVTLSPSIPTLAEHLRAKGYRTFASVSHVYVSRLFGLDRGFAVFDDSLIVGGARNPVAGLVLDRALRLFPETGGAQPWFAFLHFFDPHWDYEPPAPFDAMFTDPAYDGPIDGTQNSMAPYRAPSQPMPAPDLRQLIALYDGEIAYVDAQIGRLLTELGRRGLLENTIIVVTADHGEEFKEHGLLGHGHSLHGEQMRIPLVMWGPLGSRAGRRSDELCSLVDVAPTLLALAGADRLPETAGTDLLDGNVPEDRVVYGETIRFGNEMRAANLGHAKAISYLQGDRRVFYDLAADPGERTALPEDPSGGALSTALDDYTLASDAGWHLKLIARSEGPLVCRGALRTTGRFVDARRYFSGFLRPPRKATVTAFGIAPDGHELSFDVAVVQLIGEIAFRTDPPDAPVVFDLNVKHEKGAAGLYLGKGIPVSAGTPFTLVPGDPRVRGVPDSYARAPDGCYVRAVSRVTEGAAPQLSPEAIERLRSLGYVE